MKAIVERTASVNCGWLGVSLCLFACTGSGGARTDPADSLPPKQVLTKRIDDALRARAVDYGDEHTKVALRDRTGREVFSVEAMPSDGDHTLLMSTMNLAQSEDSDAGVYRERMEIERGEGESLPLEDQLIGALILHGQYTQAAFGNYATQDAQGCDIAQPGKGALGIDWVNVASCSRKGACCEQHDSCYKMYHCTAESWSRGKGSEACKACNKLATQCVFSTAAPGPAPCCATGSCGTERGPTWMDGDPIPPFPNPATKTGLDPSLGVSGRRGSPVRAVDTSGDGGVSEASEQTPDDSSESTEAEGKAERAEPTIGDVERDEDARVVGPTESGIAGSDDESGSPQDTDDDSAASGFVDDGFGGGDGDREEASDDESTFASDENGDSDAEFAGADDLGNEDAAFGESDEAGNEEDSYEEGDSGSDYEDSEGYEGTGYDDEVDYEEYGDEYSAEQALACLGGSCDAYRG